MSGNAVARKLLANAARRVGLYQPRTVIQTVSKKIAAAGNTGRSLLVLQQTNKVASPTKRLFSSSPPLPPPPPSAKAPKGGNMAGGRGAIPSLADHHPYHHYWHHHHRRRRGFRFGRFVALGTFGFLSYRAMVGPPILQLQQYDNGNNDDEDPASSSNKKERRSYHRWRWCHARRRGSKKEPEIDQEVVMSREGQQAFDPTSSVHQPRVVQEQVKNNGILHRHDMVMERSEDHVPIMEPNNKKQSTDPTPSYFESFPMKEMAVAALAMALALTQ